MERDAAGELPSRRVPDKGSRLAEAHSRKIAEAGQSLRALQSLRNLATWYRAYADQASNPAIHEARLETAEYLEFEAERIWARCGQADADARDAALPGFSELPRQRGLS